MPKEIIINDYITKVKQSDSRRAKYYIKNGKKKIPSKYLKDTSKFVFSRFTDGKVYLTDKESGERVLANPRTAGTPKFIQISGNALYSGFGSHRIRMLIVGGIKEFFRPVFKKHFNKNDFSKLPVKITFKFYDQTTQDVDNLSQPYIKSIFDLLTDMKFIPDDKPDYINGFSVDFEESDKKYLKIIIHEGK